MPQPSVQLALFEPPDSSVPSLDVIAGDKAGLRPARPPAPTGHAGPLPPAGRPSSASPMAPVAGSAARDIYRHPLAEQEIFLGDRWVGYRLIRARRRSIGFMVGADGLSVSVPKWIGLGEIDAALREKSRWILRKLVEQRERSQRLVAARIDWRDGTTIPYLGDSLVIVVDPRAVSAPDRAVLRAGGTDGLPGVPQMTLHVGLPEWAAATDLRDAVQSWLQRQARRIFDERCQVYAERMGVRPNRLRLSSAQTRWGSASADGTIRLNWRLIHFSLPTVDYVVAHELAHLREMNHSPRFWEVVRSACPDFEIARQRLKAGSVPMFD